VTSPALFPAFGDVPWGSDAGGGGGISVQLVSSETGIPLPAPFQTNPDAVGNDSAGFYTPPEESAPTPVLEDASDAEPVPETFPELSDREDLENVVVEPQPPAPEPRPETRETPAVAPARASSASATSTAPDNAVPFGEGGRPDVNAGFATGQGTYGVGVGDGTFGQRYGRYVDAMRRRISENWFQSMVDANVPRGRRVTLGFEILRNGIVRNVHIVESSGIRSLDDSAERAILRVRQLEPLPADYRGTSIEVEFWFEFAR